MCRHDQAEVWTHSARWLGQREVEWKQVDGPDLFFSWQEVHGRVGVQSASQNLIEFCKKLWETFSFKKRLLTFKTESCSGL